MRKPDLRHDTGQRYRSQVVAIVKSLPANAGNASAVDDGGDDDIDHSYPVRPPAKPPIPGNHHTIPVRLCDKAGPRRASLLYCIPTRLVLLSRMM